MKPVMYLDAKFYCSGCQRYIKQAGAIIIQRHRWESGKFLFIHKGTSHLLSIEV